MTTRTPVSPLVSLLLVVGGIALIAGLFLGFQSNPSIPAFQGSDVRDSCGIVFHETQQGLPDQCAPTAKSAALAWTLTITGALALVGGLVAVGNRKR